MVVVKEGCEECRVGVVWKLVGVDVAILMEVLE